MTVEISRRQALGGMLGAAFIAVATPTLLSSCAPGTPTPGASGVAGSGILPNYIPFTGITYDLPGEPGRMTNGSSVYPDNPVKIVTEIPGDGKPVTAWTMVHQNPPALDSNPFWKELNTRLGSEYSPTFTLTPDYLTKFPTLLAGGNLPDMFAIPFGFAGVGKMLDATAADLSEHLSGDAVEKYPALANIPTESWRGCVFDGRIMAVPIPRGLTSTWNMFGRKDILEAKGMPLTPSSHEEFVDMCKDLTDAKSSVWALGASPLDYFRAMLSIPRYFEQDGGKFTSAYSNEKQKDALEAARALFEAGYMNPDTIGTTTSQSKAWMVAGTTVFTWDTYSGWLGDYRDRGLTPGTVTGLQVPDFDGDGQGRANLGEPNNVIAAISNKDPERVATLLGISNWLAAPFGTEEYLFRYYGSAGQNYELTNGNPVLIPGRDAEIRLGQQYLIDGPAHLFSPGLGEQVKVIQEHQFELTKNAAVDPAYGYYSATKATKGGALEADILAAQLDIIAGRQPVSYWDTVVENYLAGGGTAITEELTESYAAANS